MIHVPIAVEQVPLQVFPGLLLPLPGLLGRILIIAVAIIPRRTVWLPRTQADPTEIVLAGKILADHVVAAPVLFYGGLALGTLFGVGRDPVARFGVVVAFLDPHLDQVAPHWIVPVFGARKTKVMAASTLHHPGIRHQKLHQKPDIVKNRNQSVNLGEGKCEGKIHLAVRRDF